jgi:formylglycine-generating enzyme required for sulfatase activity
VRCTEAVVAMGGKKVKLEDLAGFMAPQAKGEVSWAREACARSRACVHSGRCGAIGTQCVATPKGCREAEVCKASEGRCTFHPAGCGPGEPLADFAFIGPGTFEMGSPEAEPGRSDDETQHKVTLTRPFWLQTTEVTQGQWRAVMGSNPSHFAQCGADCPVDQVTWEDAVAYVNALSDKEKLERCYEGERLAFKGLDCKGYRLPTEAEWEYAARAGNRDARYGDLDAVGWHLENAGFRTHKVGQKGPNRWGLHDMLGGVWEWVHDWHGPFDNEAAEDPTGPPSGTSRVRRGGSWGNEASHLRAAARNIHTPGGRYGSYGFRVARSILPSPSSVSSPGSSTP